MSRRVFPIMVYTWLTQYIGTNRGCYDVSCFQPLWPRRKYPTSGAVSFAKGGPWSAFMRLSSLLCCLPDKEVNSDSEPTHSAKVGCIRLWRFLFTYNSFQIKPAPKSTTGTYTTAQALSLFETYADDDDPETIGPGGLERLCNDAEIPMDGTMPLILSWQLDAKEMGSFTKDEWIKGTSMLKWARNTSCIQYIAHSSF